MPTSEQRREIPPQRGIITDLYGIEAARSDLHDQLQAVRIAMVDIGSPETSRLLHKGIETGKKGGRLQGKALMVQALKIAGKSNDEIANLLAVFNHLEETQFVDSTSVATNPPPSER